MEERHFGAVCRSGVGRTHDVVVCAEEAVGPGVLLGATNVEEVIYRTLKASVTILGTTAKSVGGVVEAGVGGDESAVGDVGDVGVECVDPFLKV